MAESQSAVKYTWYDDSRLLSQELEGNVLNITVNSQNYSNSYTCQVKNPVSAKNSTVHFSKLCEQGKQIASREKRKSRDNEFTFEARRVWGPAQLPGVECGGESQRVRET